MEEPFNQDELTNAIKKMKSGKAAGPDDIRTDQLKNFGPATLEWLLRFYNETDADTKDLAQIPNNSHTETGETIQRSKKLQTSRTFVPHL